MWCSYKYLNAGPGGIGELRDRGVILDFRPPNVVRVAPSQFDVGFEDVWVTVDKIREILERTITSPTARAASR